MLSGLLAACSLILPTKHGSLISNAFSTFIVRVLYLLVLALQFDQTAVLSLAEQWLPIKRIFVNLLIECIVRHFEGLLIGLDQPRVLIF